MKERTACMLILFVADVIGTAYTYILWHAGAGEPLLIPNIASALFGTAFLWVSTVGFIVYFVKETKKERRLQMDRAKRAKRE